ncbi:MAG TPA: hypothetical protein VLA14_12370, partial [Polyangia bacterium]|nr:hypothetical protein [Polyangia bacterium]
MSRRALLTLVGAMACAHATPRPTGPAPAPAVALTRAGTQADPGDGGDGVVPQAEPYVLPPEALTHLHGAPVGQVLGPFFHVAT